MYENERQRGRERQHKHHARKRHERRDRRERKLHLELCAQPLPGRDRQRLCKPEVFPLERNRGRRHVVHRRDGAHTRAQQHLHAAAAVAEGHLQKRQEFPALDHERHARDRQQQDTESAVEHIKRASSFLKSAASALWRLSVRSR